ncbi:RNA-guided endonuclease InsQ/TnpB family protein [Caballeronia glathei]|uniref:RNA-guided endonuclease InsQ/TnpB family protein n=1 Tax=Caballeronia glathei TaxID=60547 RepID=UPI003B97E08F
MSEIKFELASTCEHSQSRVAPLAHSGWSSAGLKSPPSVTDLSGAAPPCQEPWGSAAPQPARDEPQDQVQQQLEEANAPVQRIHTRIGNVRRDYLHKATTTISQNHTMVCIEDLQVRNMSRSAAGSTKAPGKNVRSNPGLNKFILDQGWSNFRRQLDYKPAWNGGWLIAVQRQNTSRTCPCCDHISAENRSKRDLPACAAASRLTPNTLAQ